MKKILGALLVSLSFTAVHAQIVSAYGGDMVSNNSVKSEIAISEIGRSIHVASVEDGNVVVRRFYNDVWEEFDKTPISGINQLNQLNLFSYKSVPYLLCHSDGKLSVIRSISDKWEIVGEATFGDGDISNPVFSVIGETPYIVYEDNDYEVLRMISLLDNSWYDVDLMSNSGIKSYHLAEASSGDLFLSFLNEEGFYFKKVNQMKDIASWTDLTKPLKVEGVNRIDDFDFIGNKAYLAYTTEKGQVISTLEELSKKWEVAVQTKDPISGLGATDYNLNITDQFVITALGDDGIPNCLENDKKDFWGAVTPLSTKKVKSLVSTPYRNIVYAAYVDAASSKLIVKQIKKGEATLMEPSKKKEKKEKVEKEKEKGKEKEKEKNAKSNN